MCGRHATRRRQNDDQGHTLTEAGVLLVGSEDVPPEHAEEPDARENGNAEGVEEIEVVLLAHFAVDMDRVVRDHNAVREADPV